MPEVTEIAGPQPVGDGGEPRRRIGWIGSVALWLAALSTVSTLILIAAGVVARDLFAYSIEYVNEFSGYLLVATFFLCLPACQAADSFHRVEMLRSRLPDSGRKWLDITMHLLSLAACGVLLYFLARFELQTWTRGDVANTLLATPLVIPRFLMPLGTALLCLALVMTIIRLLRRPVRHTRAETAIAVRAAAHDA